MAKYLSNHRGFKTHSRHIDRNEAKERGLVIKNLEEDQEFQDLILSVYHATTLTFSLPNPVKIIENQLGKAFVKQIQQVVFQGQPPSIQKP